MVSELIAPGARRKAFAVGTAWLLAFGIPWSIHAQSLVRGELQGRVTSESGVPLAEAEVGATNERTGLTRYGATGRDGSYRISGLAAGEFTVRVEALGFRPLVHTGVPIRPGGNRHFSVALEPSAPPVGSVDTRTFSEGGGARLTADGGRWLGSDEVVGTPDLVPGLAGLSDLSSGWDPYGGAQGLPGTLSRTYVDGLPFTPAIHPHWVQDPFGMAGVPRTGLSDVRLLEAASDAEWTGSPAGYTSVQTRSATGGVTASLSGHGSSVGLWDSDAFDATPPDGASAWGSGSASLPMGSDSSRIFLVAEGLSMETPRLVGLNPSSGMALADDLGVPDAALDPRWNEELDVFSGLARLDWTLDSGAEVMIRANLARTEETGSQFYGVPASYGVGGGFRATDLSTAVSVHAPLGERFLLEVRGAFERSDRTFGDEVEGVERPLQLPTRLLRERTLLGGAPGSDGRVLRTGFVGGPVLHLDAGAHRFKAGVDVSIPSYEYSFAPPLDGFFFSDEDALVARRGAYTGVERGDETTSFTIPRLAGFAQYRWAPVQELAVVTGLRWDHEFLPADRISFNEAWWDLTGLSNVNVPNSAGSWGGRLGVTWDVAGRGSTVISGAAGAHSGRIDPALFHEVILMDGPVGVRGFLGSLDAWPEAPDEAATGPATPVLALMDPDVRAPLTTRASLSFSRTLGAGAILRLSGTYRRTDYLARRTDLNRVSLPVADSNLDRPLYGDLEKEGSVVRASSGSNRRFSAFGHVWGLNSDGWSDYLAASVALEYSLGRLDGFIDYTLSRTEDNWVGAAAGLPDARLAPALFPEGSVAGAVWEEGASDFDLPHRLVAGFDIPFWDPVVFGATFRVQSGYPFTPSYPTGTDVNADGSGSNDPAFIPDVAAVRELARDWDCLEGWIGRVVERNACRAPTVYSLDLRLRLTLAEWDSGGAHLLLEGFNLMDSRTGPRDAALVMVDPDAPITGQGTGDLQIPTVVNPDFGDLLYPAGSGRRARIGFRLGAP